MRRPVILLWLLWAGLPPCALRAQGPAPTDTLPAGAPRIAGPRPMPPALLGVPVAPGAVPSVQRDTLPCPQRDPPKTFWMGLGNLMVVQLIPFGVSNFITNEEWARVGPQTWKNNFTYPWQWDDNDFQNNQFAHPYQGSAYYNSGRTNGYDFWASSAWTLGGSLMWEYFFEAWAPAPNDLVNTVVGGIVLGEALNRASHLALDNTATGSERVWREIGGALLNPIGGFNRLVRGQTHTISANPPDWRPSAVLGLLDLGYRQTLKTTDGDAFDTDVTQLNASFLLSYGDPVKDLGQSPFSYFSIRADLAGPSNTGLINQLSARGSLAAWPLGTSRRHQLALSLEYDYFDNPAFEYSGQSAQLGVVTSVGAPGETWWGQTQVLFNGVILGAVNSDYYRAVEGRDYDYGPGLGAILAGRLVYKNRWQGTIGFTGLWLHTIDGTKSAHYQDALLVEARYWATRHLGIGAGYTGYTRHSDYSGQPDVVSEARFLRLFVTNVIPGLPFR